MDQETEFKPWQIVCLEQKSSCLYGEVIQVIPSRKVCWVRPLVLAKSSDDYQSMDDYREVIDVRETSDLIFPIQLFRVALDVEVIPILMHLEKMDLMSDNIQQARNELHNFIRQFWSSNSE